MSDMAPRASGNKELDHHNIIQLCYSVLKFSMNVLSPGGNMLVKMWQGADQQTFEEVCQKLFEKTVFVKPPSSREHSAELFLLAKGMRQRKTKSNG